ncbi:hypothetical protein [Candidatus Formimonas warabiya]|uniref:Uncharacterized protein n=1 Tax=Formimonas warabiya TaxID=1761012 RepID=A0A3G1KT96_FORW1|nr:hypothetical protein [Candidatus Formimonas warabiya]ATW25624.1 hypothetical protein DCMF_13410 [Candidatus Formimonas warabiya]
MKIQNNVFKSKLHGEITERKAFILWHGNKIAIITERMNDATEIEYVIEVLWDDYFKSGCDDTIAGIDMEIKPRRFYVRNHYPSFVIQRVPPEGREDVPNILARLGLKHYDKWDIMCKNKGLCGNDDFTVEEII